MCDGTHSLIVFLLARQSFQQVSGRNPGCSSSARNRHPEAPARDSPTLHLCESVSKVVPRRPPVPSSSRPLSLQGPSHRSFPLWPRPRAASRDLLVHPADFIMARPSSLLKNPVPL